jgi:hypothetical protein
MNYRVLGSVMTAAAIAFAQPVAYFAQEVNKAAAIIAAARKAIGGGRLDTLKTFSVDASVERNLSNMRMASDVEIVLDLPDKYLRQDTPSGGGGGMMVIAGGGLSGFNGDKPLQKIQGGMSSGPGGAVIRMTGPVSTSSGDKPTPEQLEQISRAAVRTARTEASRLMLGWFANAHPAADAQYSYLGEAESVEGKAYVIEVKNADSFNARLFIDQQSNLPLMVTYQGPQPRVMTMGSPGSTAMAGGGGHVTTQMSSSMTDEQRKKAQADIEKQMQEMQKTPQPLVDYVVYFEEWKTVDGIKFPFKMRRAMSGTTTEEWTVNKIKVNPKVDAKRFAGES